MAESKRPDLIRGIRRWDLVAIMVNTTIGAGIFGLPAKVFDLTGSYSLVAFLICAVLSALVILCFAEVGSRFDETGGPYLYAREALGPVVGFQIGWLMWLRSITSFAALCNLLVAYAGFLWPAAGAGLGRAIAITVVGAALTAINLTGVRQTAVASNVFTVGKLVPIVLFITVGLFFIEPRNFSFAEPPGFDALAASTLLLVFAFAGFDGAAVPAAEMREPKKNLPFSMFVALAVVAMIYTLIQFVCIGTLPGLAGSERPLADAATRIVGPGGGLIIAVGALISITGSLTVTVMVAPRVLFALAEHRQLPGVLSATHRRFHTPHVAILISFVVMLVVALSGTFIYALTINAMIRIVVYVATCVSMVVLRRRRDVSPALFKVPAAGVVVLAALGLCVWLLSKSTWRETRDLGIAIAAGVLFYGLYRWRRSGASEGARS